LKIIVFLYSISRFKAPSLYQHGTNNIQVTNDEYHVKVAHNLKEACALVEAGFEYVTDMEDAKIFRKRK